MYKIGYTAQEGTIEEAKIKITGRYKTYFYDPQLIKIIAVSDAHKAEKKIFEILKDYRMNGEFFKANYDFVITPFNI